MCRRNITRRLWPTTTRKWPSPPSIPARVAARQGQPEVALLVSMAVSRPPRIAQPAQAMGPAAVPPQGHPGALLAHDHVDVLHLVRLLGLGDEVAPERMEVDQRAPAARNPSSTPTERRYSGELVGCAERVFTLRRGPLGDGILGEHVVGAVLALGPSGHEAQRARNGSAPLWRTSPSSAA